MSNLTFIPIARNSNEISRLVYQKGVIPPAWLFRKCNFAWLGLSLLYLIQYANWYLCGQISPVLMHQPTQECACGKQNYVTYDRICFRNYFPPTAGHERVIFGDCVFCICAH